MNHPEIVKAMVEEAQAHGLTPVDVNDAGVPNIYLRGRYITERDGEPVNEWVEDGFLMEVYPTADCVATSRTGT